MPEKPRILSHKIVARTRIFRIEQLELAFSNGEHRYYERLKGGSRGSVLIVPMLDDDTVLMIREYAAGCHRFELGLPKGIIEEGEDPLQAANREIMEEVGYGAHDLRKLRTMTIAPGYVQHHTHIVLARNLYPHRQPGDEPEPIEVVPWRLSQLKELLHQADLTEARSIAALFLTREALREGLPSPTDNG
ncbi:MAG TPA: ADP compounds hydrolase NudE [Chromatiales bacterium]|nr:ADP compounds hydrolase NudE [Chromatiales bacterium]